MARWTVVLGCPLIDRGLGSDAVAATGCERGRCTGGSCNQDDSGSPSRGGCRSLRKKCSVAYEREQQRNGDDSLSAEHVRAMLPQSSPVHCNVARKYRP